MCFPWNGNGSFFVWETGSNDADCQGCRDRLPSDQVVLLRATPHLGVKAPAALLRLRQTCSVREALVLVPFGKRRAPAEGGGRGKRSSRWKSRGWCAANRRPVSGARGCLQAKATTPPAAVTAKPPFFHRDLVSSADGE